MRNLELTCNGACCWLFSCCWCLCCAFCCCFWCRYLCCRGLRCWYLRCWYLRCRWLCSRWRRCCQWFWALKIFRKINFFLKIQNWTIAYEWDVGHWTCSKMEDLRTLAITIAFNGIRTEIIYNFFLGYSDLEYTWCCNKTLLQLDPMCYLMFQFFHFQSSSDGDWQQNKILFRVVKSSVYIIWLIRSWLIWVIPCYRSDMGHIICSICILSETINRSVKIYNSTDFFRLKSYFSTLFLRHLRWPWICNYRHP